MNPISAWTINVQSELSTTAPIFEKSFLNFIVEVKCTDNSVFIICIWPNNGRIAFRAAYAITSTFNLEEIKEKEDLVEISLSTTLGTYKMTLEFSDAKNPIVHYITQFTPYKPILIPFWPRDIIPLTLNGNIENTAGKVHIQQVGARSGLQYFSLTKPVTGSVFYFQNLSAINPFFEATKTSGAETVGGDWPELGFRLPAVIEEPLPDKPVILSDAYVLLSNNIPKDNLEGTQEFLTHLGALYRHIPKPELTYHNWMTSAKTALHDLINNKGCWTNSCGLSYLNAYLCDYKTPPEIMVQLAVILPLSEYEKWLSKDIPVINDLKKGLNTFYDSNIKCISRWLPAMADNLDQSEEQKKEYVMDSWYLYHPLMNLSRLALDGDKNAEKLLLDSLEYAIGVAHFFDYEWPVFYKMDTLKVIKAETQPGEGGEKDVPGSYAHLMLNVWKLTKQKRYLNEAVKASKKLEGLGFDLFYQANNTAFAAGALLRLYKEFKEEIYLQLSYVCLAGILKNAQLWEPNYGYSKHYHSFFGVFPLNDAPYRAAYEEFEVYTALYDYMKEALGLKILDAVKVLLPEFIKYTVHRLPYYFPPMLHKDALAKEVKTGEINSTIWIPLEDIYDGWDLCGKIGQEVYGAGLPFGIVSRQYFKIPNTGLIVFCEYPLTNIKKTNNSLQFKIIGSADFTSLVKIISDKEEMPEITLKNKTAKIEAVRRTKKEIDFQIEGNSTINLSWKS
ncbi:hypothetical protein EV144_10854 [Flavobacterium sp. 270]|uniref:hypothetical protein n=1 Tax=Flavobacterium sp. 270 TaxID=2512114 RepID=UPI001064A245|nr:hypothetical protein [Flavobacterium sp. 270]TDW44606.1 hypothetical protein EV144_10854 [Flavobacterium sp. 270]